MTTVPIAVINTAAPATAPSLSHLAVRDCTTGAGGGEERVALTGAPSLVCGAIRETGAISL
jgi:hypothetical protein